MRKCIHTNEENTMSAPALNIADKSGLQDCDTHEIEWHKFFTPGTFYRILNVDVAARTADMLVKFEAEGECVSTAMDARPPPWCWKVNYACASRIQRR